MACTTDHTRQGSLLIVVAGLLAVLLTLATTFFLRVRSEASRSLLVEQTAQARLMLNAALQYLQEASRIGYGDPANPADHYGLARIGAGDPPGYPSYPDGVIPKAGDFWLPPSAPGGWNGDYASGSAVGPACKATERSWVGWYTPVHRGLGKDFWSQMEWENPFDARKPSSEKLTVKALAASVFDAGDGNQTYQAVADHLWLGAGAFAARVRSEPIPLDSARAFTQPVAAAGAGAPTFGVEAPQDWRDGDAAPWRSDARFRIRAELTDQWPVGGRPKLFPMYVMQEPPYAITAKAAVVSAWHLKRTGGAYYTGEPWRYPTANDTAAWAACDAPLPPFASVFPGSARNSWYPAVQDPPLRNQLADTLRWRGKGTVLVDGVAVPQSSPRQESVNLGWFRTYRETPDTFIITAGSGATQGWSLKPGEAVESAGDVVSDAPCPFGSARELRQALSSEVRLWFRATWHPGVGVKRGIPTTMGCAQGGTFTLIQRLRESELGPPSLTPVGAAAERAKGTPCPTW